MDIDTQVTPVAIGGPVKVVDERYVEHVGLVTAVHGEFGGTRPEAAGGGGYIPCINVVYVSTDPDKRDPYGAQVERLSSLQHYLSGPNGMPHPGRYWINL